MPVAATPSNFKTEFSTRRSIEHVRTPGRSVPQYEGAAGRASSQLVRTRLLTANGVPSPNNLRSNVVFTMHATRIKETSS